jgi:8-oxo-dGTP pyrophosphatase MutT (NUDIX family)
MQKQFGAVPFRVRRGRIEVMLVTARDGKRWLVPKGWPMKRGPRYTARKEAFEESGVKGKVQRKPLGTLKYRKKIRSRRTKVNLRLYPLAVKKQVRRFPERKQRLRRWFSLKRAVERCRDPGLGRLLRRIKKAASAG